jgi:glutathione S-transferase
MEQTVPKLITFGISHYCEKARWALDWHGLVFGEESWAPGLHMILAKRRGAKATSLPILLVGDEIIQGSDRIVDWADAQARDKTRLLTTPEALVIERRADQAIGIHTRALYYAECLPNAPHAVKPALFAGVSLPHLLIGILMWPGVRRVMMRVYDSTTETATRSRAALEDELDWVDGLLADGRKYLAGNGFSRADVTVASLLAPFARPAQVPLFCDMRGTAAIEADIARWQERPVMRWVRKLYRTHRQPGATA